MENCSCIAQKARCLVVTAFVLCAVLAAKDSAAQQGAAPPVAPVRVVTEDYFGTKVSDPYRYMENLSDPQVTEWFKHQDAYTRSCSRRFRAGKALLARLKQLDQSGPLRAFDVQRYEGETYFYQKRLPDEEVSKLYMRVGLQGQEKLLLDPDKYQSPTSTTR